jgi:3-hydroxy-9,10-secoandrosta-1,3,5(10)-triene-9,17-dione monooxygenase
MPYAAHFLGNALVEGDGGEPVNLLVVIPREQVTMLDDWGGGGMLGMQSSGSNSVTVESAFVPAHWAVDWEGVRASGPTVGAELHQNGLYLGMLRSLYHGGLVLTMLGAARASLDELEQILLTKQTHRPPHIPRYQDRDLQRSFGLVTALAGSAEALLVRVGELYMELGERWLETGQVFSAEDDVHLYTMLQQAGQLSVRAVDEAFSAGSSSAARRGERLQRYYRDVSMYRSHISAQYLSTATELARLHFGLPTTLPE